MASQPSFNSTFNFCGKFLFRLMFFTSNAVSAEASYLNHSHAADLKIIGSPSCDVLLWSNKTSPDYPFWPCRQDSILMWVKVQITFIIQRFWLSYYKLPTVIISISSWNFHRLIALRRIGRT